MSNLTTHADSLQDLVNDDDHLRAELQRLVAAQAELLEASPERITDADELSQLRAENAELRSKLDEIDLAWGERQREYENLLEEKSEVIRGLHLKFQQMQEEGGVKPIMSQQPQEDLGELKRQLEEERRQVQEDEEALMVQMRQMEMAMSRERAELARQRTELQRQQADFNNEVEKAARDGTMRERLQALRKPNSPVGEATTAVSAPTPAPKKQSSGLLRRLFG
jgi:hypothetical protein